MVGRYSKEEAKGIEGVGWGMRKMEKEDRYKEDEEKDSCFTGGHNRSSGSWIWIPKSRLRRLVVSCLQYSHNCLLSVPLCAAKTQFTGEVSTYFTAAGSLKSSCPFGLRLLQIGYVSFLRSVWMWSEVGVGGLLGFEIGI